MTYGTIQHTDACAYRIFDMLKGATRALRLAEKKGCKRLADELEGRQWAYAESLAIVTGERRETLIIWVNRELDAEAAA